MILDTNALSAFFDGEPEVVELLSELPDLYLPVIVMGEYQYGLRGFEVEVCSVRDLPERLRSRLPAAEIRDKAPG